MKKTNFALVLAILLMMASIGLWGQATPGAGNSVSNTNLSADSTGGHMARGCYLCHTPHSYGVTVQAKAITIPQTGSTAGVNNVCIGAACGTSIYAAAIGQPLAGSVYLWGQALPTLTYNSWDTLGNTTFNAAAVTGGAGVLSHPEVHSLMCLSCHDGATSGGTHDMGYTTAGGYTTTNPNAGGTGAAFTNPALTGTAWSQYDGSVGNNGWNSSSSLMNSHPIHAHYTSGGVTLTGLWQVTIKNTTFTAPFTDQSFNYYSTWGAVGHPARLYTDGNDAYVECTTCHEPHRFSQYAYTTNGSWNPADGGTWKIGPANSTVYYLRGPYSDVNSATDGPVKGNTTANGEMNAQFCRSCHYAKSIEYFNNNGASK
jgi:hypothetical protein